ncbi:MAG: short-chain fatty acyl-CoA regulator family protein [Sphingomonas sp.]
MRQRFGTSFEQACHRLSTLQRPGALGIPFFFCRVDMAGNITKRHSATRLQFARFGGACPLWVVHEAVAIPDRILVQLAETPDGCATSRWRRGWSSRRGATRARRAATRSRLAARRATHPISSMPTGCAPTGSPRRSAARAASARAPIATQRAFPPAGSEIRIHADARGAVPYGFR